MEKYAYMAGILDGEGSIQLVNISKGCFRSPVVCISNNEIEILNIFKDAYGGTIVKKKIYKEHHQQSYDWKITYNGAIKVLKDLLPYMLHKEKIRRANLIINTYPKVTKRNGKYTDEELALKLSFENEFFHPSATIE